ncbi:DUF3152 domain-containing protein [Umezawaea endophytica]|uniref:DUF3152 domain-containing protein n=1 Tax=Umezawaea endophytica TaxID=1654476 RepID=A0A9X2VSV4_9PSEU|nr:DUF3152 domain-containing protein [Umezawaea endophytica]MCS7482021.1 DUF3152 domain-containing protein [Umezawaea endophytica]
MVFGKSRVRTIAGTAAACAVSLVAITTVRLAGTTAEAKPWSLPENALITVRANPAPTSATGPDRLTGARGSTADLPDGPPVPRLGYGTWHVVPGSGEAVGDGLVQTFSVEVEDGVRPADGDPAFGRAVEQALGDPRGWTADGEVALRRVDVEEPALRIRLTSQETARALCGFELPYDTSCRIDDAVYLSAARWVRGAKAFDDLGEYRRYLVNHEVGHFLGHSHEPCDVDGGPAPVMMQQTFSTANDELARLTRENPQQAVVPTDGKVCEPNPWPHP